ncbi:sulfatase (macronuclear) [Tetrahymena thermophila SB210]|uniref:Sulfatase n=1 Tax=Tetrahymena thermophila (strain SB210) TaxID=312017 RepID=Q22UP0_TETTS|nr:sulfatase [Tetrahymena thermophila SB210]EAR88930.2 sulfatase [Tetrahymena thermophila SB210]|eukprot:XP_001009175.2 sulfatase [Tetrahymena thermophila SB210]
MKQKGLTQYQLVEESLMKIDDQKAVNIDTINDQENISLPSEQGLCSKVKSKFKDFHELIKKHKLYVCTGLSITLSIIQLIFYFNLKSQRCPYSTDDKCGKQFLIPSLPIWVPMILFNCCVYIAQMHMFIERSTTTRIVTIYGMLQSIYLFCFNDHTINLHIYIGAMNALHIVFSIIFSIVYFFVRGWLEMYRRLKKKWVIFSLAFFLILVSHFYFNKLSSSCDYWSQGINGQIEEIEGVCSVPVPSLCWYKITHHWQDFSLLLDGCDSEPGTKETQEVTTKFFSTSVGDSRYIGFTNLNQHSELDRTDERMQQTVFNSAKGYNTALEAEIDKHDVIFDRQEQKYLINVQFNKTLSNERKKIAEELNEKPMTKNILLIFIDAVSRQSMHLKMPKTVKWFEQNAQQHSYKKSNQTKFAEENKSQSFEFYRFNSLKPFTFDNLQTFFYGKSLRDVILPENEKLVPLIENAKKQGYVTGHTSDYCQTISLGIDEESMNQMKSVRYDHETQSYACDPNYYDPDSTFSLTKGPYSLVRRCLYGKALAEYPLEYAKNFWQKYQDNQKVFHLEFLYGHEGSGEVINHLDQYLSQFLNDMSKSGLLKDTTVIMFNDHGLHMQGLFYILKLQSVFIEINLPGLFINIPPEINEKYGNQIAQNQQNLVTIYNLHHFFKHLIYGENYPYAQHSLFSPLDHQKTCQQMSIQDNSHCSCK